MGKIMQQWRSKGLLTDDQKNILRKGGKIASNLTDKRTSAQKLKDTAGAAARKKKSKEWAKQKSEEVKKRVSGIRSKNARQEDKKVPMTRRQLKARKLKRKAQDPTSDMTPERRANLMKRAGKVQGREDKQIQKWIDKGKIGASGEDGSITDASRAEYGMRKQAQKEKRKKFLRDFGSQLVKGVNTGPDVQSRRDFNIMEALSRFKENKKSDDTTTKDKQKNDIIATDKANNEEVLSAGTGGDNSNLLYGGKGMYGLIDPDRKSFGVNLNTEYWKKLGGR